MTKELYPKHCGGKKYHCPVELCIQIIGGKWKPIILYHLGINNILRFSDIKRAIPNITQKMLTQQLRELEADGMVHRKVYAQVPPKVEYSMTDMGKEVMPVFQNMCEWGRSYEKRILEPLEQSLAAGN